MDSTDSTFTRIMFGLLVVILVGSALTLRNVSHVVTPRTDEEKRAAVEKSVENPTHAVYDSEIVVYATSQLQGIYGEMANYPDRAVPIDEVLITLVYLGEGSVNEPASVDFCGRVLPLITESHKVGDKLFGGKLTVQQQNWLERINAVGEHFSGSCPQQSSPAQQVSK